MPFAKWAMDLESRVKSLKVSRFRFYDTLRLQSLEIGKDFWEFVGRD